MLKINVKTSFGQLDEWSDGQLGHFSVFGRLGQFLRRFESFMGVNISKGENR